MSFLKGFFLQFSVDTSMSSSACMCVCMCAYHFRLSFLKRCRNMMTHPLRLESDSKFLVFHL